MSYGGRNDSFGPKPVETGREYDVQITEISRKGDGIARIQGFVIFVKGGKVGQNAKIRISQIGPRFATAEIVDGSINRINQLSYCALTNVRSDTFFSYHYDSSRSTLIFSTLRAFFILACCSAPTSACKMRITRVTSP